MAFISRTTMKEMQQLMSVIPQTLTLNLLKDAGKVNETDFNANANLVIC